MYNYAMERLALMILKANKLFDQITDTENRLYLFHHSRHVMNLTRMILSSEKIEDDCLLIAAYLHDCALCIKGIGPHAQRSAAMAKELLEESQQFHEAEIRRITKIIERHSDKHLIHDWEDEVLKNADLLARYTDYEPLDKEQMQRIEKYLPLVHRSVI